jgi:hypothetical protein
VQASFRCIPSRGNKKIKIKISNKIPATLFLLMFYANFGHYFGNTVGRRWFVIGQPRHLQMCYCVNGFLRSQSRTSQFKDFLVHMAIGFYSPLGPELWHRGVWAHPKILFNGCPIFSLIGSVFPRNSLWTACLVHVNLERRWFCNISDMGDLDSSSLSQFSLTACMCVHLTSPDMRRPFLPEQGRKAH